MIRVSERKSRQRPLFSLPTPRLPPRYADAYIRSRVAVLHVTDVPIYGQELPQKPFYLTGRILQLQTSVFNKNVTKSTPTIGFRSARSDAVHTQTKTSSNAKIKIT